MTINISVLKGDLNGKFVVVRFFFFVGYMSGNWYIKNTDLTTAIVVQTVAYDKSRL